MEIVYFVLGVVSVLLVLGVVIMVKVGLLVRQLREKVNEMEYLIEGNFDDTHRRIDDEMRDVYSQLDSRLDKLENKLITKK
jgi:predicted PurR-regulated permease PerM